MITFFQKYFQGVCLLLVILLGVSLGHLAATGASIYLRPAAAFSYALHKTSSVSTTKRSLSSFDIILQRDIFDSDAHNSGDLSPAMNPQKVATTIPISPSNLVLFGTVAAGKNSLAVIAANQKIDTYRLGDPVPGGGILQTIAPVQVTLKRTDGSLVMLSLFQKHPIHPGPNTTQPPAPPGATTSGQSIRALGHNQWVIPRNAAERARGNLNQLLQQARMEPNIVNGRTDGFVVKMVQPHSFIAMLGLHRGDIVRQVNGVDLNSPEQALQIFQQLREVQHITINLERNGKPVSFEYEIN